MIRLHHKRRGAIRTRTALLPLVGKNISLSDDGYAISAHEGVCHTPLGPFSKVDFSIIKRAPTPKGTHVFGKLSAKLFQSRPFWHRRYYIPLAVEVYSEHGNRPRGV